MIAALYRILLRAYPRPFREHYGAAMTAAFVDLAAERRANGGLAALAVLLVQTAVDVVSNSVAEHRCQRIRHRQYVSVHGRRSPGAGVIDGVRADLRFAWRSILARPGVVASVVLTLTVGTGAATAIFSVVDAVLLRPLPYPEDAHLVTIAERHRTDPSTTVSFRSLEDWQRLPALSLVAGFTGQTVTITSGQEAERVDGEMVSPAFFEVLGVAPLIGQTFRANAAWFPPDRSIVLSHALWMRQFGSDPSVVGRQLSLDGKPFTVVAVMPKGFGYPLRAEYWSSLPEEMTQVRELRSVRFLQTIGRLADGATVGQLQAQLSDLSRRTEHEVPASERGWAPETRTLRDQTIGTVRRPLALVLGAVALLTVVGCCNAAAMLLARGAVRSGEMALRAAVGASRGRIVRQLLLESLIVACVASTLGTFVAWSLLGTIAAFSLGQVPRIDTIAINARVLSFVGVFTMVLVALFGVIPALAVSRVGPAQAINATRSAGSSRSQARGLRLLVVAECAMALIILVGGGLLINSFVRLTRVDPGVDPANLLTAKIGVPLTPAFRPDPVKRQLHADLLERIAQLPSVRAVAVTSRLPLDALRGGLPVGTLEQPKKIPRAVSSVISENYFSTVGASVLAGRVFTSEDTDTAAGAAVVNSTMADTLWPGEPAVGKMIVYGHWRGAVRLRVIGVVTPIRYDGLDSEHKPEIFVTYRQTTVVPLQLVVRTGDDPMSSVAAIRTQARQADSTGSVTIDAVSTLERQLASAAARPRFFAALLGAFAAAALLISALGVHGVLSFWSEQRRQEFGVRVALGATRGELYRQVLGQGTFLATVGIAIGLAIALTTARTLAGLLFGITAWDATTYAAVSVLLLLAAVAACVPAARRAASVDPVQMLRAG